MRNRKLPFELGDSITPRCKYSYSCNKMDKKMNPVHLFSFESIAMATNNFSAANKLERVALDQFIR